MKRVLLVEDDTTIAQLTANWLNQHPDGFSVLTAKHGRETLDLLACHPVDIVVSDLHMPVMDGFELIAHLHERTDQPPHHYHDCHGCQ